MQFETLAVHAGRRPDPHTGAVVPPIHLSTSFEADADGRWRRGYSYSREENPNRRQLEECLAALEGGKEALAFSSGLAAATAVIQAMEPGDHLLLGDNLYYAFRRLVAEVFAKWRLETSFVDMTDLDQVRAAVRPNTRLIWLETPSNPLLKIVDLAAIAEIGHKANAISVCDGTFATAVLQRPLEFGIDMVVHSSTKYLSGHGDAIGGVLITKYDNYAFERARKAQKLGGAVPSPFDCWLIRRGIDTLALRVRAQSENALALARHFARHAAVERVLYPGLPEHPGHKLASRQMKGGYGGMLSIQVHGGREEALCAIRKVRLFTRATSLGATHSLIEHRATTEGPSSRTPPNLLRLSIGIENVNDLIADLEQALDGA